MKRCWLDRTESAFALPHGIRPVTSGVQVSTSPNRGHPSGKTECAEPDGDMKGPPVLLNGPGSCALATLTE
jgi:hypothetical protein